MFSLHCRSSRATTQRDVCMQVWHSAPQWIKHSPPPESTVEPLLIYTHTASTIILFPVPVDFLFNFWQIFHDTWHYVAHRDGYFPQCLSVVSCCVPVHPSLVVWSVWESCWRSPLYLQRRPQKKTFQVPHSNVWLKQCGFKIRKDNNQTFCILLHHNVTWWWLFNQTI